MRNYSRFVPGEEIADVAEWRFGAVDTASLLAAEQVRAGIKTAATVENDVSRQEGFADGYAQGFAQGHAQATLEGQKQINEYIAGQGQEAADGFTRLFEAARASLAEADQVIAQGVLELACELARQVVRRELSVDATALQPVVREALSILVADSKSALVRLNPLDMDVLQDGLSDGFAGLSLSLVADASVSRGGCLIESAGTVIDGQLEKRWVRAVANLGLSVPWEEAVDDA
jgi:flagellar assembly protein FliH